MTPLGNRDLAIGETWRLPDGAGSITFDGVREWGNFQVASDPGRQLALAGAVLAIVGVIVSLSVPRRRVWVRATTEAGSRTLVEVAGLARSESGRLEDEVAELMAELVPDSPSDQGVTA